MSIIDKECVIAAAWTDSAQGYEAVLAIAVIFTSIVLWAWRRLPHRRLRQIYLHIERWWEDFYLHVEDRDEDRRLSLAEKRITTIIVDSGLRFHQFKFHTLNRPLLLAAVGIKEELAVNDKLFEQWTKLPFDGIDLDTLWLQLTMAAHRFRGAYPDCSPDTAVQNIENRLKCFKVLVGFTHSTQN